MKAVLDGLKALGPLRLGAMAAVAAVTLALLAFLALRGGDEKMSLLYAGLDPREAGQMVEQLERAHIPHQEDAAVTRIMVPRSQVAQARLLLAKSGLPSGGSVGYEIFDHSDALTASRFQDRINETRALEGELERSIRLISGVRGVRVHLVLPTREPFARQQQVAQAGVLLTMAGGMRLDREGVRAVLNLVAAAVPGLRPENIAIIDNHGTVLSRAGAPLGPGSGGQTAGEIQQAAEMRLSHAVEDMLAQVVGAGHVRAETSVTMDFDRSKETQEKYDPDGQVARSEQSVTDDRKRTERDTTVSVKNNLPNANLSAPPPAGTQEQRREETTNYEISKTVRTLMHEEPQIQRISVAVLVDGVETKGADGKEHWRPRTPEELQRLTALVKGAIGYDAKRGDSVQVVSMRFAAPDALPAPAPRGLLGLGLDKSDVMRLAETALVGLVAILALLLVLRPLALRLSAPMLATPAIAAPGAAPAETAGDALEAPPARGLLEDESMVDVANVEGQMRASSIRRIADLVDKHPEETIAVMRGWMVQEGT